MLGPFPFPNLRKGPGLEVGHRLDAVTLPYMVQTCPILPTANQILLKKLKLMIKLSLTLIKWQKPLMIISTLGQN